jgi:glycosyltransferase involved in cell wall biosynthesis
VGDPSTNGVITELDAVTFIRLANMKANSSTLQLFNDSATPAHQIDILAVGHAPVLQINRRLYRALVRLGWQLEIAIPTRLPWSSDVNIPQPDQPDDPPIHRLEPRGRHIRYWRFDGLGALLDRRRPRIIYLENGPETVMAWLIGGWCKRNNAILVANTNENDLLKIGEILQQRRIGAALRSIRSHLWGRVARGRISHVVAICQDGREAMRSIGFADAVSIMPLGFDADLFFPDPVRRAAMREKLGLFSPVVAYFGRLSKMKGVHILIAALGRLRDKSWQLLIDDFEHDSIGAMAWLSRALDEAAIRDRVITFTASHDAIPDYMRAADIVVVPSIVKEQYGRVASEAMACGCTVIVSDIGALPELVGDAGVIVAPGDVAGLSHTISELLADPERCIAFASRAQSRAREELRLNRQAAQLDSLFQRLIEQASVRDTSPEAA